MAAAAASADANPVQADSKQPNLIQVSLRFPVFRFVAATRRLLREGQATVELSGIGNAITSVVSVAEIMKKQNLCEIVKIETAFADIENRNGRTSKVAKISVTVKKGADFDKVDAELQKQQEERKAKESANGAAAAPAA